MEWLQSLLDSSSMPAVTALLLGLLTALSPCPLATNIAAIGYIGKHIGNRRGIFINGFLYTLGRTMVYSFLGILLIALLRGGNSILGIQHIIAAYGERVLGPVLLLVGLLMLWGDRLPLKSFGFSNGGERFARRGGVGAFLLGVLFALAFCPTSGVLYFGMLIPLSVTTPMGYLLPALFAVATALPVLIVAWILAFSAERIGVFYGRMQALRQWLNRGVGILFIGIGIYYCITIYFKKIMEVKVLGPGCAKCKATYAVVERVVKENHLDVTLTKVDDIMEMMRYNILSTPAVVVDGVVKLKGVVPSAKEVKEILGV